MVHSTLVQVSKKLKGMDHAKSIFLLLGLNSNGNHGLNIPVELSKETNVIVEHHNDCSVDFWCFDVTINGKLYHRYENPDSPKEYSDVKVYAGSPWADRFFSSNYGTVWGLKINNVQIGA